MQTRKGFLHSPPHLVVDWRSNDITLIRCACASERCVGYNQSIADNVKGKGFGLDSIHQLSDAGESHERNSDVCMHS